MYTCCVVDCNIHIEIISLLPTVAHWNMSAEITANARCHNFPIIPRAEEQIRNYGTKHLNKTKQVWDNNSIQLRKI